MNITSESHLAATVLCINGDLTSDNCDRFQRDVRETAENFSSNIIIDCSSLQLIDSVGLESLLWLTDELTRAGNKLRFAVVPASVESVFELTRLDRVFSVHESVEHAARSFA
jgi:anti-sigma B factor antagonist